jgi:hypothetical protein
MQEGPALPRYEAMGGDSVVMSSKLVICDIVEMLMDICMEVRLTRFVKLYQSGVFKSFSPLLTPAPR